MGDLDCEGRRGGIHSDYSDGGAIVVHLQIVILVGIVAATVAPVAAFTLAKVTTAHETKDIVAEVGRGQNLDGGEDVVEAGEQHEDDPVGLGAIQQTFRI